MIVYLIINKLNEKKYVGITVRTLELRWKEHQRAARKGEHGFYISNAIRKHGIDNFEILVIEKCTSHEALVEAEKAWIASLGTFGPGGYNLTDGGEGAPGRVVTAEQRKRMSIAAKNRAPLSEEGRKNISISNSGENNAFYGKAWGRTGPLSEEAKEKLSIAHTGKVLTEEHKAAISAGCMGKPGPNLGKMFTELERYKNGMSRKFPVDIFVDDVHIFTSFSVEDACALFKPSRVSVRKMLRILKNEESILSFSFVRSRENISTLKKLGQKG